MSIGDAFEGFIKSRLLAGLADTSVTDYRWMVKPFLDYFKNLDMEALCHEQLEDFIMRLLDSKLSKATKASYLRHTKVFLRWYALEHGGVSYHWDKIKLPKTPKKNVRLYSPDDIRLIFDSVDSINDWLGARNKAVIALMLDSGIRQAELCSILKSDIYSDGTLKIYGKGCKERIVPIGGTSRNLIHAYLEACPFKFHMRLFVDRFGEDLSCSSVKQMIACINEKLDFDLTSHKLRHNFATNYCINQYERVGHVDIYRLMALMGHESLQTTKRYLHHANQIMASRGCISHLDSIFNAQSLGTSGRSSN